MESSGNSWGTVITIVLAVISSGALVALINFFQTRRKNNAESEDIWDQIKDRNMREADRTMLKQKAHIDLCEYKLDLMIEGWSSLIYDLETADNLSDLDLTDSRQKLRNVRFLKAIPGQPEPDAFEPPETEA